MSELLSAGWMRLRRSKLLWITCALLAVAVVGLVGRVWFSFRNAEEALRNYLVFKEGLMDGPFFTTAAMAVVLSSPVCAWFIGAEYQDGAIRCKLSVGCRRRDVYLSALALTALCCVFLCAAVFLPGTLVFLVTVGRFGMGWSKALWQMAGILTASIAFASLFTLLGLNISSRTASAIATIFLTLALIAVGSYLMERLSTPPTTQYYVFEPGTMDYVLNEHPNANYIPEGPVRSIMQFFADFLPGGHISAYTSGDLGNSGLLMAFDVVGNPGVLMAFDAVFALLTTLGGFLIFRRKDLR